MKLNLKLRFVSLAILSAIALTPQMNAAESGEWRNIPLINDGFVHEDWMHIGYGGWSIDKKEGAIRTEPAPHGLGLLVYKKEKLGNCQIRVVFKTKDQRSNAGVYVRIADGILRQAENPGASFDRDDSGKISDESMKVVQASAEREEGPWYAVHQGYEVQIAAGGDSWHRTGAIYSLAPSAEQADPSKEWHEMIITLDGEKILVDLDGKRTTTFDAAAPNLPKREQWHEPKREHKRPTSGYIGLQTHDPGDVVWFKEVSVRPLSK